LFATTPSSKKPEGEEEEKESQKGYCSEDSGKQSGIGMVIGRGIRR
jgi:hypothetical protein